MKKLVIKDIAKLAGVSYSAVSKAINKMQESGDTRDIDRELHAERAYGQH